ncbi:TPA: hypothetical protein ACS61N_000354 [Klebsiella oxytoca]|uniref:hypothetical protein n=1 Tax=Klebsiella oxytoca TaxID=571 RepID=UPI00190E6223|nr:hypothetical protein [Klebsiella oxytoca]EJV1068780.1 hypothetical protein [Klebsiella oxytoca]MBZ7483123.1 hypothetical protein [Klebsiella oxytoca]
MRRLLIAGLLFLSPFCYAKSDAQIVNDAKEAVRKELSQKYKPGDCERWRLLEGSGKARGGSAVINCDSNFNPLLGLDFSDIKVFRRENSNAVCGIVSGHTDISRIGGRFVYTDGDNGHVFIKNSKYPSFLTSKNVDMLKLLDKQLEIESINCN